MLADIQRLSIAGRIQLVEDIWDAIAATPDALPLTEVQCQELDHRLEAMQQNPQEGISWPELKATRPSR
ncbi:MAG TPA: addiction module protein [Chthonomonadaceae bacterium]|jgi:putative addiction module component (TIGR02574 family)|nr:addiction module protein [Chthonomonadaceae bacterium]